MDPFRSFDAAMLRAEHLLKLYDLVCDSSRRDINSAWAADLKARIGWPPSSEISRIYGKDQKSLLVFQHSIGIDRSHFSHDYASELLRAALVASVSALDRCMHDIIVKYVWQAKDWFEDDKMPKELRDLNIPIQDVYAAVLKARTPGSKPGALVRKVIQDQLGRRSFQKPDDVDAALRTIGIKDVWNQLAKELKEGDGAKGARDRLHMIVSRRNQIVHEADLVPKIKSNIPTLRYVDPEETAEQIAWMRRLGGAIQTIVNTYMTS